MVLIKKIALILFGVTLLLPGIVTGVTVTRTFTGDGNTGMVTLTFQDFNTGGVIERLPPGVTYLGSNLPDERVLYSGNDLIFAVIQDAEIQYRIAIPDSRPPSISGQWEDIAQNQKGQVSSASTQGSGNTEATAHTTGIGIEIVIFGLLGAVSLLIPIIRRSERI